MTPKDIKGKEIKVGDKVAYATLKNYVQVLFTATVTKVTENIVVMGKYSCRAYFSDKRILIIDSANNN